MIELPPSPYKGLAPFEDSDVDAILFFGRERERKILIANLMASRLTVLYGPSGVGKSSLVRAGVAHELGSPGGGQNGESKHAVIVFRSWAGDPVAGLKAAVAEAVGAVPGVSEERLAEASLADALELRSALSGAHLYVLLDQFEEYFLYHAGDEGPGTFLAEFPEAIGRPELRASFLLSVREDALARLDVFKPRIPNLFGNYLRLEHLDRRSGRAAIVGPVEEWAQLAVGDEPVQVDGDLVEAVLDGVAVEDAGSGTNGDGGVEAPYLQLVMSRLWDVERERGSTRLRLKTLVDLGGAGRIVEEHLERALAPLSASEQETAAAMFDHLVTPSGTKVAQNLRDLATYAAVDEQRAGTVVGHLVDQRVLRPAHGDGAGPRYEIFHDVLGEPVVGWRRRHAAERDLERARGEADRKLRRLLAVAVGACIALALMLAVTIFALSQRSRARADAHRAQARALAATALSHLADDPQQGLRDALAAAGLEHTDQIEHVLRQVLIASPLRAVLRAHGPVVGARFSPDGSRVLVAGGRVARLFNARGTRLLRELHDPAPLTASAFSPDGKLVLTADAAGRARLWDAVAGRPLLAMRGPGPVTTATFSRDGRLVIVGGGTRVWVRRVDSGRPVGTLRLPGPVRDASLSPDNRLAIVVSRGRGVRVRARVFDVRTGRLLHVLAENGLLTAVFSPDGNAVATGSADRTARLWDARTGRQLHVLEHHGHVVDVEFSLDGKLLATASEDGTAAVWDVATGARSLLLVGANNLVESVAFSPDGRFLVVGSLDRSARVYSTSDGRLQAFLAGHRNGVTSVAFSPDGRLVVSGSVDGTARIWEAGTADELALLGRHGGAVQWAAFSPDGRLAVSAGDDGTARIWRLNGRSVTQVLHHAGPVERASFSPNGELVVTSSDDGTARIWSASDGRSLHVLRHAGPVGGAVFSNEGRLVATASRDGTARIWDASSGSLLETMRHERPVRSVAFSPDGRLIVTSSGPSARIWNVAAGTPLRSLQAPLTVVKAAFSPDGKLVLAAASDGAARLWRVRDGRVLHVLQADPRPLTDAEFSADGTRVVTTGLDHDAHTWDVASGEPQRLLRGHFNVVNAASFSPDGRWIVTAGPTTAGLWEAGTGRLLFFLRGDTQALTSASFSADGRRILTSSLDGSVRTYDCAVCGRLPSLVALARARLAAARPR